MESGVGNCGEEGKRREGADREGRGTGWSAPQVRCFGREEVEGEEEGERRSGGRSGVAVDGGGEKGRVRAKHGEVVGGEEVCSR